MTVTVPPPSSPSAALQQTLSQTPTLCNLTILDNNGTEVVAQAQGAPGTPIKIKISSAPKLWDPDDAVPHLYDLRVQLSSGDEVVTYFGLRTWALPRGFRVAPDGPLLTGEPPHLGHFILSKANRRFISRCPLGSTLPLRARSLVPGRTSSGYHDSPTRTLTIETLLVVPGRCRPRRDEHQRLQGG